MTTWLSDHPLYTRQVKSWPPKFLPQAHSAFIVLAPPTSPTSPLTPWARLKDLSREGCSCLHTGSLTPRHSPWWAFSSSVENVTFLSLLTASHHPDSHITPPSPPASPSEVPPAPCALHSGLPSVPQTCQFTLTSVFQLPSLPEMHVFTWLPPFPLCPLAPVHFHREVLSDHPV